MWANFRVLIGIFSQCVGPSLAIWANPVQFSSESRAQVNGATAIDDPGCYATVQMEGGLVVSVAAGNSLSGDASLRLYGTLGNAEVLGRGIVRSTFFGEVSSTGTIIGEPVCRKNSCSDDLSLS